MKRFLVIGLLGFWVIGLAGCKVRSYTVMRDRIDQNLSSGNRGYIQGNVPPGPTEDRKLTRPTQVVEIELGLPAKGKKAKIKSAPKKGEATQKTSEPKLEAVPETSPEVQLQKYEVQKGDTLQKISQKLYGTTKNWQKIYDANKDSLKGPDKIYPGQVIYVPVEEMKEPAENLK